MRIACIDDSSKDGSTILSMIKKQIAPHIEEPVEVDYFPGGSNFFHNWTPGMYRLIVLDIFLDQEDGIEIARMIRKIDHKAPIVICSSSNDFAAESYEIHAGYYLKKPATEDSVRQMIYHMHLLRKDEDLYELPDHRMLPLSQFLYSEYYNHQITIHLKNKSCEKIWSSQTDFVASLSAFSYFMSVNPGTVVNLKEIIDFKDDTFLLTDGSSVPISKRKKKELLAQYKNFLFMELREEETWS